MHSLQAVAMWKMESSQLRSYNSGREDSGGAQAGRPECQDPGSDEQKTPCEGGHIGVNVLNAGT